MREPDSPKATVGIGTLGHVDHGKTTLAAAITKVLAASGAGQSVAYDQIDVAPTQRLGDIPVSSARIAYETASRRYSHADCPGHADFVKAIITGAAPLDGAILVVSAADGPMPQTREHLSLARRLGLKHVIVFLNKADMVGDAALLSLVEGEIRTLLDRCGWAGTEVPIVRGSALQALQCGCGAGACPKCGPILELLAACDARIPSPAHPADRPLLMAVEEFYPRGTGVAIEGRIERGRVAPGDRVELVGFGPPLSAEVSGIEESRRTLSGAQAGDSVGLVFGEISPDAVRRGQAVVSPGSPGARTRFKAEIYLLAKEEGGLEAPLFASYAPRFVLRTAEVGGTVSLGPDREMIMPGDHAAVEVTLDNPVAVEEGLRFSLRDGGRTVGAGTVTQNLE